MFRRVFPVAAVMVVLVTSLAGADTASSQPTVIVAFGDSTTAPRDNVVVYATLLEQAFAAKGIPAKVVNAGVGGNTTALARARFDKDVLAHRPSLVIIQFGLNDAAVDVWKKPPATQPRVSPQQYEKNLRHFVETLKARGAEIILMTPNACRWTEEARKMYGKPPYRPNQPDGFNVLVTRYAEIVRQVARQEKVALIDVYAAFQAYGKEPGQSIGDLLGDAEHPNSKGHELIARLLLSSGRIGGMNEKPTPRAATGGRPDPFGGRHVLLIGIDGCRPDALRIASVPHLQGLIKNGTVTYNAHVGGTLGAKSQQPTVSGPGWASILTGVWIDKHWVSNNDFKEALNLKKVVDGKIAGYPHFFTRIKEKYPDCYLASIVNWEPINTKILSDADYCQSGDDEAVARQCVSLLLGEHNPTVVFLHFDAPDAAGHSSGFSPENPRYVRAIEAADQNVGLVLDAMKKRPAYDKEDWLVLVTTDHGGREKKHGGQSPEERTVFIIASGGGYPHKVLDSAPGVVAVVPTIFRHLGIPVDPAWGWEEPALKAEP